MMNDFVSPEELLAYLRASASAHEQARDAHDKLARAARRLERTVERRLLERDRVVVDSAR